MTTRKRLYLEFRDKTRGLKEDKLQMMSRRSCLKMDSMCPANSSIPCRSLLMLFLYLSLVSLASCSSLPQLDPSFASSIKTNAASFAASLSSPSLSSLPSSPFYSTSESKEPGCASPEVLVNGSPSPDILETVNGGRSGIGNIQEIQFVGMIGVKGKSERRRICKIKCLNGVWVGPLCTLEAECPPLDSKDLHLVMSVEGNKPHDRAHFTCLPGFVLDTESLPTSTSTTNISTTTTVTSSESTTISTVVSEMESVCTATGSWSHPVPSCRAVSCPELESEDPNLKIEVMNRSLVSSQALFSCPEGFKLSGVSSSSCLKNGSWSHPLPSCEVTSCQPPLPPVNGRVIASTSSSPGHFKAGDYVDFACNPGFIGIWEESGSSGSMSICLPNGSWSQSSPDCKAVCQFPGEPKDGYIVPTKFHYFVGEGISVVCKANHQPLGPAFIYCTREGKWSAPLTSCVMILQETEEEQQGRETKMPLEEEYRRKQQPHYHASMNPGERQQ